MKKKDRKQKHKRKKKNKNKQNKAKKDKYMLFAGWEVRIVKNCDGGLFPAVNCILKVQMGLFT